MIDKTAKVESKNIGKNTKIWQFCVVLPGAKIGENCQICSHCFIENKVIIGNNVTIKNGVQIWDGIRIMDNVFVGPNVTFTNDKYPKSRRLGNKILEYPETIIGANTSIGAAAVILPGIVIGENVTIAAGAIVTRDVPSDSLVIGTKSEIKENN
jgi:acetyltransferase-like isoleucine patch superfamily enzyme